MKHNQIDALKLIVKSIEDYELVNSKDNDGNIALHLVVADKQVEVCLFHCLQASLVS